MVVVACGGDVFTSSDGGGADGSVCRYDEHRAPGDRACNGDGECAYVMHVLNCCQDQAEGIRADRAPTYTAAENAQQAGCKCLTGCAAETIDDLQQRGTQFAAACDSHVCTSHAQ
jgi:hypothetical protein